MNKIYRKIKNKPKHSKAITWGKKCIKERKLVVTSAGTYRTTSAAAAAAATIVATLAVHKG